MNTEEKKLPLCFYHKNCLDGIASAWVVWKHFEGQVELIAKQYGESLPEHDTLRDRQVYLVDFSWPRDFVIAAKKICELTVLDHHASAAKALEGLVEVNQSHSGAVLTWKHFYNTEPPFPLLLVEDYDLWKYQYPETRAWNAAAQSYEYSVEEFDSLVNSSVASICNEGVALLRQQAKWVGKFAKTKRTMRVDEFTVPVVNVNSCFTNDIGNLLGEGVPFAVMYSDGSDKRIYSLRGRGDVDLSEVATRFGGGGHRRAAAFSIPFEDYRFAASHLYLNSEDKE